MTVTKGEIKKQGRPKSLKPKEDYIKVRLTKSDKLVIKQRVQATGLPLSNYCREMLVNGRIVKPFSDEEVLLMRSLSGIANNINQLAKAAHQTGIHSVAIELEELKKRISNYLVR